MSNLVVEAINLKKAYHEGAHELVVLNQLNLAVKKGESVAILGSSGSGKSTLLHLLGGLDHLTAGEVRVDGTDIHRLKEQQKGLLRNRALGFVYQFHHLLPEFDALENVMMPLWLRGCSKEQALTAATEVLSEVGLAKRLSHRPAMLSGGERQRVAIARALVGQPLCLLADEPTGNLDRKNAHAVFDLMLKLNQQMQTSLIIVTHDLDLAKQLDRTLTLQDGCLV